MDEFEQPRRLARGRPRGQVQMREDLSDHARGFDGGDDLQLAAAVLAMRDVGEISLMRESALPDVIAKATTLGLRMA